MLDTIKALVHNRRVLILGFGREGRSTYRVLSLCRGYKCLDIADKSAAAPDIGGEHRYITGEGYLDSPDEYDIVFKSPGIVLPQKPYKCRFTSQTDIFLRCYGRQTVGITGTKGKSTVSTLLAHTLNAGGLNCILAGNIGIPAFEVADKLMPKTIVVLELSCHQLELCAHSPSVAVLLNIFEDHLDHYGTFERYAEAKTNIYRHQCAHDTLFCIPSFAPDEHSRVSRLIAVSAEDLPFNSLEALDGVKLRGAHNLLNCAFVYALCKTFGVGDDVFTEALRSYRPLPHRLEFIGAKNGTDYYDDSISTTVESAISAVKSIPNASVILLGGMDRGIDYSALAEYLPQSGLSHVILMYESGKRIYDMLKNAVSPGVLNAQEIVHVPDLYRAARLAQERAKPGTACILSPAAASYGDFKDFEERGNVFKELIFGKQQHN